MTPVAANLRAVSLDGAEDAIEALRKSVDTALAEAECSQDDIPLRHKHNLNDAIVGLNQAREAIERMR